MSFPFVSIIIPCRNEKAYIGPCLESIAKQTYPQGCIEVIVVDGLSNDGTQEILQKYVKKYSIIRAIENSRRVTPAAINLGIRRARSNYIMVLSSHSKLASYSLEKVVRTFSEYETDCIGGLIETRAGCDSITAQAIALALAHRFGVGNSHFRIGSREPKFVDTVPFGCYRKEVFEMIGFFDEELIRNQDDEFNHRLIKKGGKVLLIPEIVSYYYARDSLSKLFRMYFQYGYYKPLVAQKIGGVLTWRQLVPPCFVGVVLGLAALSVVGTPFRWALLLVFLLYAVMNLSVSFGIAMRKGLKYVFALPIVFSTLHVSYGVGYLEGLWDFLILKKNKRTKIEDIPLSR